MTKLWQQIYLMKLPDHFLLRFDDRAGYPKDRCVRG